MNRTKLPDALAGLFGALVLAAILVPTAHAQSGPGKQGGQAVATPYPDKPLVAPPAIVKAGELVMAINASVPPSMYLSDKGEIIGYRAEMGREIAARLGLKPVFVNVRFPPQIPGLTGGRWDVSMSGAYITPERTKVVMMIATESQGVSISTSPGNPKKIHEEKDLSGLRVGVEHGSFDWKTVTAVSEKLVAQGLKPVDIRTFEGASIAYQALRAGQLDAVAANDPIAQFYQNESANAFEQRMVGMNPTPQSIAVRGGNEALAQAIVNALNAMKKDGWYDRLVAKYGFGAVRTNTFEYVYTP